MKKCLIALAVLALCPAPALGGLVFFDDFEGNALQPHWIQPPISWWQYDVSNSQLNVTGVFNPSHPKSAFNFASMAAPFAPQADVQFDATMGWESMEGIARFELLVMFNQGIVATIGYREDFGGVTGIFAATNAGLVNMPSPLPGMYDFRITRVSEVFQFYFEGNLFATLPSSYTGPVNGLRFFFASPYPGPSGPFFIDSVQVIPAPGAIALLSALIVMRRRRRDET